VGVLSPVTAGRSCTATAPACTADSRSNPGISSGSAPLVKRLRRSASSS
jgi:hypothetical protein